jgi:TolB protein
MLTPRRLFIIGLCVFALFLLRDLVFSTGRGLPEDGPTGAWKTFVSPRYKLQLKYPAHWTKPDPLDEEAYEGHNGFFNVSGLNGPKLAVEEAMRSAVGDKIKPYGSDPQIISLKVDGQEARLIMPSSDQPAGQRGQGLLVVRYPTPVKFRSELYHFAVVWADRTHLSDIASTLTFLKEKETGVGTLAGKVTIGKTPASAFASRKVMIYTEDGAALLKEATIDPKGRYAVSLEPGIYKVDINYLGIDRSADVPKLVIIEADKNTPFDIKIDTGVK